MKKAFATLLGVAMSTSLCVGALAACDNTPPTVELINVNDMAECILGEEYDFEPNIVKQSGVTYTLEVSYLDSSFTEVDVPVKGMKFTPDVITELMITVTGTKGGVSDYAEVTLEVGFYGDSIEEEYMASWKDTGIAVSLNPNTDYIKDGASSLKYSFNGVPSDGWRKSGATFLVDRYPAGESQYATNVTNWYGAKLTFWVYNPGSDPITFGLHTGRHSDMSGPDEQKMTAAPKAWTLIALVYDGDPGYYNYIRCLIGERGASGEKVNQIFYLDDLKFINGDREAPKPETGDANELSYKNTWSENCVVSMNNDPEFIHDVNGDSGLSSIKYEMSATNAHHGKVILSFRYQDQWNYNPDFKNWTGATLSFWVYNPNDSEIVFGLHTVSEPDMSGGTVAAAANSWSQVTLTYHGDPGNYNFLRVRTTETAFTFYLDDFKFTEGTAQETPDVPDTPAEPAETDAFETAIVNGYKDSGIAAKFSTENVREDATGNRSVKLSHNGGEARWHGATIAVFDAVDDFITKWTGATISFWVYNPNDFEVVFGLHNWANGADMSGGTVAAAANGWTQITFTYPSDPGINYIRMRTGSDAFSVYIDGITITEGGD